jgi:hypothetical protein
MKPRLPAAIYAIGATSLLNDASSEMIYPLLEADLVPAEARARGFGMYYLCVGLAAPPACSSACSISASARPPLFSPAPAWR